MRREGTDPDNVKVSDVLCDFCRTPWDESEPMIEGHQGSCMCGKCLTVAYTEVVVHGENSAPEGYSCTMCLESGIDREALGRKDEAAWQSPLHAEAAVCRRCIELAAKSLEKDKDFEWRRPGAPGKAAAPETPEAP